MKRFSRATRALLPLLAVLLPGPPALAQVGDLRVEIHSPTTGAVLPDSQSAVDVTGGASIFGGVRYLDLFFVIDTSKSLLRTDPQDYRSAGAVGLVKNLPASSDIKLGVVGFDDDAQILSPLTKSRSAAARALSGLDRRGSTDLAAGIRAALAGFRKGTRPDSSKVMLLFTDGKSDEDEALAAMAEARAQKVAIHTLLLGSNEKGASILRKIAEGTGGSFVRVTNPSKLPEAFLNLRTTGVREVTLSVDGSSPIATSLIGGHFSGRVPVRMGENTIVATATSLAGERRQDAIRITVSGPLQVRIESPLDGTLLTERRREAIVEGTASAFADPAPEFLARHPDRGVSSVVLTVNGSPPFATELVEGRFRGRVMLGEGENRIVAVATAHDGRTAQDHVRLAVRPPGCGELQVEAVRDGSPALSISDRAVEIVVDASGSMWGQIDGRAKISIAKEILRDTLAWLPRDLMVALRVYGHRSDREARDCRDSELVVPFGPDNRSRIGSAIDAFQPRGQTPLDYSLRQIAGDFGRFRGERAIVLVTDGIESCGGDPVAAARALQTGSAGSLPVHVIGFGLGEGANRESLRGIAHASGGVFVSARNAEELRSALNATVGTAYEVLREGRSVARGNLGDRGVIRLPEGGYTVRIASEPPYAVPVDLRGEESLTLMLKRERGSVFQALQRRPAEYFACGEVAQTAAPLRPLVPQPAPPAPVRPLPPLPASPERP